MPQKPLIGFNFLHEHPNIKIAHSSPDTHVVVDREDWEKVCRFFRAYPEHFGLMLKDFPGPILNTLG